ncbi:MAG TPA: polymorphic toxin-type HINT domain-containing protein [archaeon]|nr:polymorphic toxin-type HINT domain-containing protein [archaeon]
MNKINLSKIFLILAIAIISLNLVFAGSMAKRYRISGDLIISNNLDYACQNGGDWTSGSTIEENEYESGTGIELSNVKLNEFFDKLFFVATPASTCSLEIWSPSGVKVYERSGLNANAIKTGLNEGIVLQNVVVDTNSTNITLNFAVKIKHATAGYLLETTVKVPNINNQLFINADNVIATISETESGFDAGAKPVLMLEKRENDGQFYYLPVWRRINTYNIASGGVIPQNDLSIVDRNMTGKDSWVLSWDAGAGKMKWTNEITTSIIKDGTLLPQDFNPNAVFSKIGGTVVTETVGSFITGSNKYLKFTHDGIDYYLKLEQKPATASSMEVGSNGSVIAGNTYTRTAQINAVTGLTWGFPSGITIQSGQGTATATFLATGIGAKTITLNGTTNTGSPISDSFTLNVSDSTNLEVGGDMTVSFSSGSSNSFEREIVATGVNQSTINWEVLPSGTGVTINDVSPASNLKKRITVSTYGTRTIKITGISVYSGQVVTDSFILTAAQSGGSNPPPGPPGGGINCFKSGTPVLTSTGYKPIESIKQGDLVYSLDEKTNKIVLTKVNKLLVHDTISFAPTIKLKLNNNVELIVTTNHAFYDPIAKGYKQLRFFTIGDKLLYYNGTKNTEVEITSMEKQDDLLVSYNLSLEYPNNYFVNGILVHNDIKGGADINPTPGGCYQEGPGGVLYWYDSCQGI